MKNYTMVVERCAETGFFIGSIPGWAGAHTQAETLEELRDNMKEVIEMLLEDGEPEFESEFVGTEALLAG